MKSIPPIKAVMTPFPYWVEVDDDLERARTLMAEHRIRHLPVMDDGALVGVLSERELRSAEAHNAAATTTAGELCTRPAYSVETSQPLDTVLRRMVERHIAAAIVTRHGKLAGIFTTVDGCRAFAELLEQLFPRGGDDRAA